MALVVFKLIFHCLLLFLPRVTVSNVLPSKNAPNSSAPSEYFQYFLLENESTKTDPCDRKCVPNAPPMVCKYNFKLEWYDTLSKACFDCPNTVEDCFRKDCVPADGIKRSVLVVNRKLPGPAIRVCVGDQIVVDVENALVSDSTTIHWHGIKQKNSPYMDGVPSVTQCPILPQNVFRYQFLVDEPGTHFWHSHTGMQRGDGVFGSLIIRTPKELDPHKNLYDFDLAEHVIVLMDWDHSLGIQIFTSHHHNDGDNKPPNLLVNGLGRFNDTLMPTARFKVKKGFRYRFRVINAGFLNCPIEVSIDNHTLNVISSDGYDFKNITAESLVTYAGERFDFVLNADQNEGVYWMKFGGLMDCDERFTSAFQTAVLQYENEEITPEMYPGVSPTYREIHKNGTQINPLNKGTESRGGESVFISAPDIESMQDWDESLKEEADFRYYISYDFYRKDNPHFHKAPFYGFSNVTNTKQLVLTPQLNHISMKFLSFPLLTQRDQISEGVFCNESTIFEEDCKNNYCECPHVVNIDLNSVVELVVIDKGFAYDANHPFHLHGHSFRVVAMERIGQNITVEQVYERDISGKIKRNLVNPPMKDTVTVPDGGFSVLRFHATNPGYWLFHCHIEFHAEIGMAVVFKVGEHSDMVPTPKNFPKCGNYLDSSEISPLPLCENAGTLTNLENGLSYIFGEKCSSSSSLSYSSKFIVPSFSLFISFIVLSIIF